MRMKRLLPGEQVIMSVATELHSALAVGDSVQPTADGVIAKTA